MSSEETNIRRLHLLSGSLVDAHGKAIPYWPVEISQFCFSALTDAKLQVNEHADFVFQQSSSKLVVISITPEYRGTGYDLVSFRGVDSSVSLEQNLRQVPELKRWNPQDLTSEPIKLPIANLHVRAARFTTEDCLRIHARTFGTRGDFVMQTENVSKSGMLIKEYEEAAPFSINTILELTIDPETKFFAEPVRCLAKIVRREGHTPGSRFGVQLIEMDASTQGIWSDYVEELERSIITAN